MTQLRVNARSVGRPCAGDLGSALCEVLDERGSPCLSKLFTHGRKECIQLTQGLTQGGSEVRYPLQVGMPRKEAHWLKAHLDSSLAWSTLGSVVHDQLSWSCLPGQGPGLEYM